MAAMPSMHAGQIDDAPCKQCNGALHAGQIKCAQTVSTVKVVTHAFDIAYYAAAAAAVTYLSHYHPQPTHIVGTIAMPGSQSWDYIMRLFQPDMS
jgi:hypothetical protein